MDLNTFGGRKFLITLGCGVATTALTWFGKIDGGVYSAVIIATVAAYIAGNAAQHIKAPPSV
jgi:hypothetical protein